MANSESSDDEGGRCSPSRFLVVEDEPNAAQTLVRMLKRFREVEVVPSVAEAKDRLEKGGSWTGAVVDIGLPDGSGLEVVQKIRAVYPLLPVLVLTGSNERAVINRTHQLQAEFACKPATDADLRGFVRRAVAFEQVSEKRVARVIDELARKVELSPRETDLIAAAVAEEGSRDELRRRLGVSENTLKTQVRQILRKSGHESLDALVKGILRVALSGKRSRR